MQTHTGSSGYTPFALSVIPDRDEVVLVPAGDLDMESVDELEQAVRQLKDAGVESMVIDLSRTEFIDSTGLRTLIGLRNDAKRNGHALALIAPGTASGRIFDITMTRALFDWRKSVAR